MTRVATPPPNGSKPPAPQGPPPVASAAPKRPSKGAKKASGRDKQIEDLQRQITACRKEMVKGFSDVDEQIEGLPTQIDATTICSDARAFEIGLSSNGIRPRLEAIERLLCATQRRAPSRWQRIKAWWSR